MWIKKIALFNMLFMSSICLICFDLYIYIYILYTFNEERITEANDEKEMWNVVREVTNPRKNNQKLLNLCFGKK